jgi:trehalose-phosphatase
MTASFWSDLPQLGKKIRAARKVFLVLDFDGTLAPLVDQPSMAKLPESVLRPLRRLVEIADVAVMSGRAMADVRRRVGIRAIAYGGNHGIEIVGPGVRYLNPVAQKLKKQTQTFFEAARLSFQDVPGVHIETKGFGLSLHYRHVPKTRLGFFKKRLAAFQETTHVDLFHWTKGHMVSEMRPQTGWDKGKALRHLWSRWGKPFVLCVGDDVTDEDMFRAMPKSGVSVKVGKGKTRARYRLARQIEVAQMLEWVIAQRPGKGKGADQFDRRIR